MSLIDMTGRVFDRLTVVRRSDKQSRDEAVWVCKCLCGRFTEVLGGNLREGHTRSCGCLQSEHARKVAQTLGIGMFPNKHAGTCRHIIEGERCGKPFTGPANQKFCADCQGIEDAERKRHHARKQRERKKARVA